jgi:hypothetical protein
MTFTDIQTLDQYLDRYGHLLAERTQASPARAGRA